MLDTFNPDDYIIGVVHLPPGKTAKQVFNNSEPVNVVLQKFFKKMSKVPQSKHRRRLPSVREDGSLQEHEHLELVTEDDGVPHRLPFVGPSSKGGYCLRQLNTYRLQVCLTKKLPDEDSTPPATCEAEDAEVKTSSTKKRRKRHPSVSVSLNEPGSPPTMKKKTKRRKTEQL